MLFTELAFCQNIITKILLQFSFNFITIKVSFRRFEHRRMESSNMARNYGFSSWKATKSGLKF